MEYCKSQAWRERRNSHVLLAEDDSDFRVLLAQAFRSRGYEITECVDGRDLVSKLGTFVLFGAPAGFDLVISDIRMPGATAFEVLNAMRECEAVPPVILITAFPSEDTLAVAHRLGVAAVLNKPFEIEDLMARVEKVLGESAGDVQ